MYCRKPSVARKLTCLILLCVSSTGAYSVLGQPRDTSGPVKDTSAFAEKRFALELEGSDFTAAEREEIRTLVQDYMRENHRENIELTSMQGPFGINAACPLGFVRAANFRFSTRAIEITKDAGSDCDGARQCRTWTIEAVPEDFEETYDFELRLQCSNDDALRNRTKQANSTSLRDLVEGE